MSNSDETKIGDPQTQEDGPPTPSGSVRGLLIAMAIGLAAIGLLVAVELSRRP